MTKHAQFSPSASKAWMNCFGRHALCKMAPPSLDSPASIEGTKAHKCLEFIAKRYANRHGVRKQALAKWPKEMVDHAINSAEVIFKLRPSKSAKLFIESHVRLKKFPKECHGTLDYAWVDLWGDLIIIDYKYGRYLVDVDEDDGVYNHQLMIYLLGMAEKYDFEFENFKIAILQPRAWENGDDPLTIVTVPIKILRSLYAPISKAIAEAKKPNAPLVAGDHCKFCPALSICPENSKVPMKNAEVVFDTQSGVSATPDVMSLTAKTLERILPACKQLEVWIEAVRAQAFSIAQKEKIKGYKLVPKNANRSWNAKAEKAAVKKFGDEAFETEKIFLSPSQLEKKHGIEGKQFAARFSERISKGVDLVPELDKRPEVIGANVFDTKK